MKKISIALAFGLALVAAGTAIARTDTDPPKAWQDVRALVVRFNDAQNAHNLDVASALLLDSPDFEWIEGDAMLRGHDAAVDRLARLYAGTFIVLPDYGRMTVDVLSPAEARIILPVKFGYGVPGSGPNTTETILVARALKTDAGWRLARVQERPALAER